MCLRSVVVAEQSLQTRKSDEPDGAVTVVFSLQSGQQSWTISSTEPGLIPRTFTRHTNSVGASGICLRAPSGVGCCWLCRVLVMADGTTSGGRGLNRCNCGLVNFFSIFFSSKTSMSLDCNAAFLPADDGHRLSSIAENTSLNALRCPECSKAWRFCRHMYCPGVLEAATSTRSRPYTTMLSEKRSELRTSSESVTVVVL